MDELQRTFAKKLTSEELHSRPLLLEWNGMEIQGSFRYLRPNGGEISDLAKKYAGQRGCGPYVHQIVRFLSSCNFA